MVHVLKHEALIHGDKLTMLSIQRLQNLKNKIECFSKTYHFASLIMSDFEKTEYYLHAVLAPQEYHIQFAPNLPLKRVAAKKCRNYSDSLLEYFCQRLKRQ